MANIQDKATPPAADWRFPLIVGLSVGLGLPISRDVATAWTPRLGPGGAFALSLVMAAVVGGLVALVLSRLLRRGREHP